MSVTTDFYLARAAECARDAEATALDNVRERFRCSEVAWRVVADRLLRGGERRDADLAARAARIADQR